MDPHPSDPASPLLSATARLLRPLVRLLIRSGVTCPTLVDVLRGVYVDVARQMLPDERARTDSRLSIMTGIHRKELRRYREAGGAPPPQPPALAVQLVARWLGEPGLQDPAGNPIPLPRTAPHGQPSFESLVAGTTRDIRPRAVLDEWVNGGIVASDPDGNLVLQSAAFLPRAGTAEQLFFLGRNTHDHLAAAAANVSPDRPATPFLDRSVHYDGLSPHAAARLATVARDAATRMLLDVNRQALAIAEHDDSTTPRAPPAPTASTSVPTCSRQAANDPPSSRMARDARAGLVRPRPHPRHPLPRTRCPWHPSRHPRPMPHRAGRRPPADRAWHRWHRHSRHPGRRTRHRRHRSPASGILGVVTGFASVCLAGEEVQYAADTPIQIDGAPARAADLRAGQVAAVAASGPNALRVAVRHEVSGPLDAIEPSGLWRVAGQPVLPPPDTAPPPGPGTWLAVSGFRREDGVVAATRLDPRPPGETLVRGIMTEANGRLYIGLVEIRPGPNQLRRPGIPVTAIGRLRNGILQADTVEPDALLVDPNAYFGTPGLLVIQGYAQGGFVTFGGHRYDAPFRPGLATLRLERGAAGQFNPVSIRPFGPERPVPGPGATPRTGFQPAPMPNRAAGRAFGQGPGGTSGYERGNRRRQDRRDSPDPPEAAPRQEPGGFGAGFGGGRAGGFGGGRGR